LRWRIEDAAPAPKAETGFLVKIKTESPDLAFALDPRSSSDDVYMICDRTHAPDRFVFNTEHTSDHSEQLHWEHSG
jgi:hypothetical protein